MIVYTKRIPVEEFLNAGGELKSGTMLTKNKVATVSGPLIIGQTISAEEVLKYPALYMIDVKIKIIDENELG